ncbi:MAG: DegT/DnrJ/EryC1/StrS family aminotransferase [Candidatus Bathyarchaeia archaeon]
MKNKKLKLIEPVIGKEEIRRVSKVLCSGWLTEGRQTEEFEEQVRKYIGVDYAIATTSCTTAIELALRALGIGPGDEVIIPDFTHPATGNMVKWVGATPVLVDVDLFTYNIVPEEIEKAVTRKTRCIIPVSWGGNPLDFEPLNEIKLKHELLIVEDAACSLGAESRGKKTGTMADITCLSFHPRKIITTGEGGMAVTDNPVYAKRIHDLKKFGMTTGKKGIRFTGNGTNYKLSDVLAAIGIAQMQKINRIIDRRIELAHTYDNLLSKVDSIRPPQKNENVKHTYQSYAVYIEKEGTRDKVIKDLQKENIETQIGTYALHMQPSYEHVKKIGKLTRAKKLYKNLLTLPMCHSMTKRDQERVVAKVESSMNEY